MAHTHIDDINWNELHHMTPTHAQDAHVIADLFDSCLHTISELVAKENSLLSQGAIEEALALFEDKEKSSVHYARASDLMRRNLIALTRLIPSRLPALKDQQQDFVALLNENAKLIMMIRSLSETMLRSVAQEVDAHTQVSTYGKDGKRNQPTLRTPSRSIIVSTSM